MTVGVLFIFPNALEIVVISRVLSGRTGVIDWRKPGLPFFYPCLRLLPQQGFVYLTGRNQILQSAHYSISSMSLFSVLAISA
jgi:hypothetical protein